MATYLAQRKESFTIEFQILETVKQKNIKCGVSILTKQTNGVFNYFGIQSLFDAVASRILLH